MHRLTPTLSLAALLLTAACGDGDDGPGVGTDGADPGGAGASGTIAVHLEETDAIFVEGFDVALRFETADGQVVESLLWNEFVAGLDAGDQTIDAFYDSVLDQPVPAGVVTVFAEVAISPGGALVPPDPEGELGCELEVDVPEGGDVEVEVSFAGAPGCLSETS